MKDKEIMTKSEPNILSSSYVSPIGGKTYLELKEALKNALSARVSAAYLFGSIVSNTHLANDVDLILVKETDVSFTERTKEFFDLYDIACPIDILVYTEEEFQVLRSVKNSGFWKSVNDSLDQII